MQLEVAGSILETNPARLVMPFEGRLKISPFEIILLKIEYFN
jgi:hypothetical protein